ncbi:hypothetical protein [Desulfatitalea tepidiphila]|uniref:hypothetical protein n=1 Tax=Desulfatitalea tepidiphila TaxID=1185843 RepID=UPI0006B4BFB1|nr:hypothetical protein [Desulfatitalea tepidiphila]
MADEQAVRRKLKEIEAEIEEARRRLPAHSVKPALMAALFDLEDQRDAIVEQLLENRTTADEDNR